MMKRLILILPIVLTGCMSISHSCVGHLDTSLDKNTFKNKISDDLTINGYNTTSEFIDDSVRISFNSILTNGNINASFTDDNVLITKNGREYRVHTISYDYEIKSKYYFPSNDIYINKAETVIRISLENTELIKQISN